LLLPLTLPPHINKLKIHHPELFWVATTTTTTTTTIIIDIILLLLLLLLLSGNVSAITKNFFHYSKREEPKVLT
jgi:uncharacterized integral membrane protein